MRRLTSLTPVLFAILACTSSTGTGTDSETSTGTTTDTSTSTGTSPSTTTTGELTTGQPTTGGTTTTSGPGTTTDPATSTDPATGTTTDGTTTDDTTTGSTGSSTTGEPENADYAAFFVAGGLDRIVVRKADYDTDLCISVQFASPMNIADPAFELPDAWAYEHGEIAQGTVDCLVFMGALPDAHPAETAMGSGSWPAVGFCPDGTVDVDVTLNFPPGDPWVPAAATITATGLPLQGC